MRRVGVELFFDERLVVPDQTLKISDGALAPGAKASRLTFFRPSNRLPNITNSNPLQMERPAGKGAEGISLRLG